MKKGKSGQTGVCVLGIAVFDHDAIEDLGWIQKLELGTAPRAFVAAEAAALILHVQQRVDTFAKTGIGNHFRKTTVWC